MAVTESAAFATWMPPQARTLPARETIYGLLGPATTAGYPRHDWLDDVRVQIKELLLLDEVWDSMAASAVTVGAVDMAIRFLVATTEIAPGLRRPFVSPTQNGGVNLEWNCPTAHFDVTFEDGVWIYASAKGVDWEGPLNDVSSDAVGVLISEFVDR